MTKCRVLSEKQLKAMAEEATVDCNEESEAAQGWFNMLDENLGVPFETELLGIPIFVERVDVSENDEIVAVCRRGQRCQSISLLDIRLPSPPPAGAEWIEAYRRWSRGR